jgi:hypothetical protein
MRFSMNTPSENLVTEKITGIVDWFTQKRKSFTSTDSSDALYAEIHQLKKTLATAPTKPTRAVRNKNESLEPVTEQQKIMDMAG